MLANVGDVGATEHCDDAKVEELGFKRGSSWSVRKCLKKIVDGICNELTDEERQEKYLLPTCTISEVEIK